LCRLATFHAVAFDNFRIVKDIFLGKPAITNRKSTWQIPLTLFMVPEFAHIGLREHEAKSQGIKYRLAKLPMGCFPENKNLGRNNGIWKEVDR
jgi:pyruvate/2-oxoglutarate dehydrogenase complex dihydrolipoamide dehydrogenase (E3) component